MPYLSRTSEETNQSKSLMLHKVTVRMKESEKSSSEVGSVLSPFAHLVSFYLHEHQGEDAVISPIS